MYQPGVSPKRGFKARAKSSLKRLFRKSKAKSKAMYSKPIGPKLPGWKSRARNAFERVKASLKRASLRRQFQRKSKPKSAYKPTSFSKSKARHLPIMKLRSRSKQYDIGAMQFAPVYQAPRRASAAARSLEWA